MGKTKVRIEIIDIAKAITIFLVIMGHTTGNFDDPMFRRVIYSFHMPLFFILAGLSIKPKVLKNKEEKIAFIRKNILALIVPYLIWGLIYGPFSFENILKLLYGSWASIASVGTLTSLWYLPCLFVARMYIQIVFNLFENKDNRQFYYAIITILFFIIGFIIPYIEAEYIWCFNVAFVAAGFIMLGVIFRKQMIILSQQKLWMLFMGLIVSIVMMYFGTVYRGDALELSLMCRGLYGNIFWFMYNALLGSIIVLSISAIISQLARESSRPFSTKFITYIGSHTMGIFLLHKNIVQQLIVPVLSPYISNLFVMAIVASLIDLPIVLILCWIIERYVPQLLGEFPVNEYKQKG